ncbi:hypothetical protein VTN00DRAFT_1970 [Thermoascus crustaceus]|uniref:uncharacterized protein n=1 Tax=Thermoascus crustaceus TaxID=5088 RepID=UPI0037444969
MSSAETQRNVRDHQELIGGDPELEEGDLDNAEYLCCLSWSGSLGGIRGWGRKNNGLSLWHLTGWLPGHGVRGDDEKLPYEGKYLASWR